MKKVMIVFVLLTNQVCRTYPSQDSARQNLHDMSCQENYHIHVNKELIITNSYFFKKLIITTNNEHCFVNMIRVYADHLILPKKLNLTELGCIINIGCIINKREVIDSEKLPSEHSK